MKKACKCFDKSGNIDDWCALCKKKYVKEQEQWFNEREKIMIKTYRHGDVLIKQCKSIPKGARKKETLVVAEGETTGHQHQITKGKATLYAEKGVLFLSVEESATITHEEHAPIVLPAGDYEIRIQREYEPKGWRYVAD